MKNKTFTAIIVLAFLGFLLIDFSEAAQPDITSHRAHCKMKIVQNRLAKFDKDIMRIARRITDHELTRYVRAREIEAAPAPAFIPPSYPPNLSPSFFVSAPVRPCSSVAKGGF